MALVQTCDRCGLTKVIDTHCSKNGRICFDCLTRSVEHELDCPTAIRARIERNKYLATMHDRIAKKQQVISKSRDELAALVFFLRQIDPCDRCHKVGCDYCSGLGYNPRPSETALNEPMPKATY